MGDCGSLYLGFTIGALALVGGMRHGPNVTATLLVPAIVLALPIFDTVLVIVARRLHGRPVTQGGRDHTTHRLAALGLSEPGVALALHGGSAVFGALALAAVDLPSHVAVAGLMVLALGFLGAYLGSVPVYTPDA